MREHRVLGNGRVHQIFSISGFVLFFAVSSAQASDRGPDCSRENFDLNSAATLVACDELLKLPNLSSEEQLRGSYFRARSLHRQALLAGSKQEPDKRLALFAASMPSYEAALRLRPDDPEIHLTRGWVAYYVGDFERAWQEANLTLRGEAQWKAEAYVLRGSILRPSQGNESATEMFEQSVDLAPNSWTPLHELFESYYAAKRYADSLRLLDRMLALPQPTIINPEESQMNGRFISRRAEAHILRADCRDLRAAYANQRVFQGRENSGQAHLVGRNGRI